MGLLSSPTYDDYLKFFQAQYGNASEGGADKFTEAQWNALGPSGQWNQLGGGMALGSDDPRWAELSKQLGITANQGPDATVMVYGGKKPDNPTGLVDPSKVINGDGSYAFAHSNFTPQAEFAGGGLSDKQWGLLAASLIGGAALYGANAGWGAEAGAPSDSYWGSVASNGGTTDVPIGEAGYEPGVGNPYGPGGFDSSGFAGTSLDPAYAGAPVSDLGVPSGTQSPAPVAEHSFNSGVSGLLGNAGSWATAHPLQALGLLQTGYGLVHGASKPAGSSSSTKGGDGSPGNAKFGVPQQQFYVNPYIAAQIQRGYR